MGKHKSKIIIILSLIISLLIVSALFVRKEKPSENEKKEQVVPIAQAHESTEVSSPDGKMVLTLKPKSNSEGVDYSIELKNEDGLSKEVISKTEAKDVKIVIPENAFSPDNKYFFVKEDGAGSFRYLLMNTSGKSFSNDLQMLDLSEIFFSKYKDIYYVTEATGWAGPGLIIVNTNKKDGSVGPSFWFDVASKSYILLSTRFN